jgi:hypothetical protein
VSRGRLFHALSAGLLIALAALAFSTFGDYGVTADEPFQNRYGNRVARWYTTLGEDDSAVSSDSRYWGGLFELSVKAAQRLSPLGVYETRHLVNALFGLAGIAAAWWIGLLLAGPPGGLLAAVVLAATPLYWGNAFNEAREIPFAALFALGTAALVHVGLDCLPGPGWRVLLWLLLAGAVIGLAAAVHVSGLALLGLAALAWLVCTCETGSRLRPLWRDVGRAALDVALLGSTAWLVMVLFWPFAQLDPVLNPLQALRALYEAGRDDLVPYGGRLQPAGELPRHAAAWLLAITLPETYLLAALMGVWRIVAVLRHAPLPADTWTKLRQYLWLLSACALPVLWTVLADLPPRGGPRSLLFVVPVLAGLAGASAAWWLRGASPLAVRTAGGLLLAAAVVLTGWQMVRLHPFQAAYFNRLLGGGLARSVPLYGADDGGAALKQGIDWVVRSYARPQRGEPVRVAGYAEPARIAYYLGRTDEGRRGFEAVPLEAAPHLVLAPTWGHADQHTPGRVVHVVEREGWALLKVFEVRRPAATP